MGNKDSLSVKADLKNISFNLNGQNIEGKAAAFIDNDKMNLYESSFKWGIHKIDNIEAFINPSEQKGALTFLYEAETKKQDNQENPDTKASFSFNFTSTADKKNTESQNIIENTIGLTSHFNIDMKISDWVLAGQKGERSIKASLVKEPNISCY